MKNEAFAPVHNEGLTSAVNAGEIVRPLLGLMEQYGETEVNINGVRGPLGALVSLCPVPPEQRNAAANERWAGKLLATSGIDWWTPRGLAPDALETTKSIEANTNKVDAVHDGSKKK